tara:strand:- start:1214 stop:1411 length:198 start_codon:yes stop_codon:yes gene_type:complete
MSEIALELKAQIVAVKERIEELRWEYDRGFHNEKREDWEIEIKKAKDKLRKVRAELLEIEKGKLS